MKRKVSSDKQNVKENQIIRKCVECGSTEFFKDFKLDEISCLKCGLVAYAPPSTDFITDGFLFENVDSEKKK